MGTMIYNYNVERQIRKFIYPTIDGHGGGNKLFLPV
jgi:hypothetical protein